MEKVLVKRRLKLGAIATGAAIVSAVALPQIIHLIGIAGGTGNMLGSMLLPMHIAILLVGFIAGPFVGFISGALSPLISFFLSGMPMLGQLPFMIIELTAYGLAAGLLRSVKLPVIVKVLIVQVLGRAVRLLAILFAGSLMDWTAIAPISVIDGTVEGLLGIVIQLTLIPLLMYRFDGLKRYYD